MVRFSLRLGILFSNHIKLNLSICDSNQIWDSSQLCIFGFKPGFEPQKYIRVNWVLRLVYCIHSPLGTIYYLMVQNVVPSNGNLLGHLKIGHKGVIQASSDQQNELEIHNFLNWVFSSNISIALSIIGYLITVVACYTKCIIRRYTYAYLENTTQSIYNQVDIGARTHARTHALVQYVRE